MDHKKLFNYAILTGEIMLRSGAETSRVEDTINRILATTKFTTVESFVTPTGIFATLDDDTIDMISFVKRVHRREIHLNRVAMANDLSRRFCAGVIELEDAYNQLEAIKDVPSYPNWIMVLAKGIGAGSFAVVFGGDVIDMCVTMIIGFALAMIQVFLRKLDTLKFFEDIIGGSLIATIAIVSFYYLKIGSNFDLIVIGSIMPLVPGVAITNAIRDIIQGDFISGMSRAADAFIIAASVAVGVGSILKLFYLYLGGAPI
ncbi:MAG: threonine/serine exporter [Firmicutes bacterium HGW-Firmicutes-7]|nr:MAG: threonine/serine exporter [Firmicutes bacterium HGW-Firmicutes-7]